VKFGTPSAIENRDSTITLALAPSAEQAESLATSH